MSIHLIQSSTEFQRFKKDWNSLLVNSASHVPFLRHEYLETWWSTLGGGEWGQAELAVLVQKSSQGMLTGIAPFFISDQQVRFLGAVEISDYLDLITTPDNLPNFTREITQYLCSSNFPSWEVIILDNLPEDSPSIPHLQSAAGELDLLTEINPLHPAPYLRLPGSWEEYLAGLDDRYRHEIQRKNRKAEEYFLPLDWYVVENSADLDQEVGEFLTLMSNNPLKEKFLTKAMTSQMISAAGIAFQEGWLQLAFLTIGDRKVAGYLNFDLNNRIWVYNSGIDPLFENLSPGWVLLSKLIQQAILDGKSVFDFMRGNEEYKYQFGGIDSHVVQLKISKKVIPSS